MLFSRSLQRTLLKILSLFSLVRGYNIAILVIAQYLTARYILSPETGWWNLVFDLPFFCIVAASALTTAAGYIINNFYDAAKLTGFGFCQWGFLPGGTVLSVLYVFHLAL
jgi:4-hydroxybenzoate polyprenyltransferase